MSYGMYISAAGASAQQKRLELISNNLANVDTPGFKEQFAVLQARHSAAIRSGEAAPGSRELADIGGGVAFEESRTSYATGPVRPTGNATDFLIDGDGFFLVEDGAQRYLTRAGNFRLDAEGYLLTQQGFNVLSQEGIPIVLDPRSGWTLEERGTIQQGSQTWSLGLVRPPSIDELVHVGENVFKPLGTYDPVERDERSVRQGFLEMSSVQPAATMMSLIETSRAFETNVRMIQNHDAMASGLIRQVLRA